MPRNQSVTTTSIIPVERIERHIYLFRGVKVILSSDLADLYGVATKQLNQAVKRNLERFPPDFMFQLTWEEAELLRSQIVTLKQGEHLKFLPYAFTEEGVAMLSAVLRSPIAVQVSVQIIRVFVRLRELLASQGDLRKRLEDLERTMLDHDQKFAVVFDAIRELIAEPREKPKARIGFQTEAKPLAKTKRVRKTK